MMINYVKKYSLYAIFGLSLFGSIVSIYFSFFLGWTPCVLCWYQRILLFPIVLISLTAILLKDKQFYRYLWSFSVLGILVALFHNLLYWGIIPESAVPCKNGVSCTVDYLELFGFISIPLMSLAAFVLIFLILLAYKKYENK